MPASGTQEFISHLLKYGVAKTNRFQVVIPLPISLMRKSNIDQSKTSTILSSDVIRLINSVRGNSNEVTRGLDIMIDQSEIPGKSITTSEMKYNGDFYKQGYSILYDNIPIIFRSSLDMYEKNLIDEWLNFIVDPRTYEVAYMDDYVTDVIINQLDTQDNIVYSVVLRDAFPINCATMPVSNEDEGVHKVMTNFAYRRWERIGEDESNPFDINKLGQSPLSPILSKFLTNPAIKQALRMLEEYTGIDLEGEAVNIYNMIDDVVRNATGSSVNDIVGILFEIKANTEINDKLPPIQQAKILEILDILIETMSQQSE